MKKKILAMLLITALAAAGISAALTGCTSDKENDKRQRIRAGHRAQRNQLRKHTSRH